MEKKAKRNYFFQRRGLFPQPCSSNLWFNRLLHLVVTANEFLVRLQPRLNNVFKRHTAVPIESVTVNNRLILLVKKI